MMIKCFDLQNEANIYEEMKDQSSVGVQAGYGKENQELCFEHETEMQRRQLNL